MDGFVSNPHVAIMHMEIYGKAINHYDNFPAAQEVKPTFRGPKGKAVITRRINGKCMAVIDSSGQIKLTLEKGDDIEKVEFSGVTFDLNWKYFNALSGELYYHDVIPAEIKNLGDEAIAYVEFDLGNIEYKKLRPNDTSPNHLYYEDDFPTPTDEGYYDWDIGYMSPGIRGKRNFSS